MHAGDEMRVARDLFEQAGRVPEVPDVELDPNGVAADLLEELGGIAERVQDRPALDPLQLERLDGQPQVETLRLARDLAYAADRGLAVARAGEAEDRRRLVRRENLERAQHSGHPLAHGAGAGQQRQRMHRRNRWNGRRGAEAARPELLERVVAELELPDSDPVDSGLRICAYVVREA